MRLTLSQRALLVKVIFSSTIRRSAKAALREFSSYCNLHQDHLSDNEQKSMIKKIDGKKFLAVQHSEKHPEYFTL